MNVGQGNKRNERTSQRQDSDRERFRTWARSVLSIHRETHFNKTEQLCFQIKVSKDTLGTTRRAP